MNYATMRPGSNNVYFMRLEVFREVLLRIHVFWDVTLSVGGSVPSIGQDPRF